MRANGCTSMQFSHWYFKANKALWPLWQLLFTDEEGQVIFFKKFLPV